MLCFQDEKLKVLVETYGESQWELIASKFPDRSDVQCQQRWYKVVNPELVKGPWTKEVRNCFYLCFILNLIVGITDIRSTWYRPDNYPVRSQNSLLGNYPDLVKKSLAPGLD